MGRPRDIPVIDTLVGMPDDAASFYALVTGGGVQGGLGGKSPVAYLFPNAPKKKLANGSSLLSGENPAALRTQIDEWPIGSATPRSYVPWKRGMALPFTYCPCATNDHRLPVSSSTLPSELRTSL